MRQEVVYNEKVDVWSFGMFMFELMSLDVSLLFVFQFTFNTLDNQYDVSSSFRSIVVDTNTLNATRTRTHSPARCRIDAAGCARSRYPISSSAACDLCCLEPYNRSVVWRRSIFRFANVSLRTSFVSFSLLARWLLVVRLKSRISGKYSSLALNWWRSDVFSFVLSLVVRTHVDCLGCIKTTE